MKALDLSDIEFLKTLHSALEWFVRSPDHDSMDEFIGELQENGFGIVRLPIASEIEAQERDSDPGQYERAAATECEEREGGGI